MAQVKKFKNGNVLKYKRGNIVLNGEILAKGDEMTDEYLSNMLGGLTMSDQWITRINNGEDLMIDDVDGGVNSNFGIEFGDSRRDNRRERRAGRAKSPFESKTVSKARIDLQTIRDRLRSPDKKEPDTYDLSKDITLKIGEDGKILRDADYSAAVNRVKWLKGVKDSGIDFNTAILNYGERNHTWDSISKNELLASLLEDPDAWDESMKEMASDYGVLIGKKEGKPADSKFDPLDINKDGKVSDEEKKLGEAKAKYKSAGLDYDTHSPYVIFDDAGNMVVTPKFNEVFGSENAAYNDFWRNSQSWLPENDWLYGYSRYGNRLYKTSDVETEGSELHRLLSNAGFYNMNLSDNYSGANRVFKYLWDSPDEWNTFNSETMYWDPKTEIDVNGLKYRSGNGLYSVAGMPEGTQILEYYSPSESRDKWGRPVNYYYGLFDKNGNFIENVDKSKLSPIQGGQQLAFNGIQERIYNPDNTTYHGRVQRNYDDGNGNYIKTYWKPGEDMIVEMSDFNKWNQLGNGKQAFKLPKALVDIINRNPNFWNKLLESSSRERFIATLRDAVSSQASEVIPFVTLGYGTGKDWMFGSKEKDLGFSAEDLIDYMNAMKALGDRNGKSTHDRERSYLTSLYTPIESKQQGGLFRTTVADNKAVKTTKVEDSKDINKAAGTNNKGVSWDSLTSADKMQLASIVMDLGSLGLTMAPGVGGLAAAAAGVGGTAAQFSADVKRDGLDWGDVGYGLLGLGLDVATILPGIGSAAKLSKIGKGIAKIAPVIKGVLLSVGAADGIKGLNNILRGDYSIDDFRSVANGLAAGVGIGRKVGEINASKMKTQAEVETVKPKTAIEFEQEYIDDFIKRNPKAAKFGDGDVEWYNPQTKQVTNYEKAKEGLKGYTDPDTKEKFNLKEGVQKFKATYEKFSAAAKKMSAGIWGSKNNPFSDNFRWRSTNRTLGATPEEIREAVRSNPKAVARLANLSEDVANELRSIGYSVESTPYVRARVKNKNVVDDGGVATGRVVDSGVNNVAQTIEEPAIEILHGRFDDTEFNTPKEFDFSVPEDIPVAANLRMLTSGQSYPLMSAPNSPLVGTVGGVIPRRYTWRWTPYRNPRIITAGNNRYLLPESTGRYLLPAPNGTQLTLFKKGGYIKKYKGGAGVTTVEGFKLPNIGHRLIDAARHVNAYTGRKKQSELMEKSIQAANYNNVIPQYDQLSSTSGLGVLMQRGNIEKQALNNAYANVPKTSRYSDYLSMANSRAEKSLESERALNLDINNLLTNNERTRLEQSNAYKSQVAQLIGGDRRRHAATQSALWQERAGKVAGDVAQVEAGLEQEYGYYNQHKNLESATKNMENIIKIQEWYNTKKNEINQEILADLKASKLDSDKYYTDPRYTNNFKVRMDALDRLYQYKLAASEIENTMSPFTGGYFNVNIPRPKKVSQTVIPGVSTTLKKGGTVNSRKNKTAKEMNHERILKNIELDNKRIIQLNENILKLLMTALK